MAINERFRLNLEDDSNESIERASREEIDRRIQELIEERNNVGSDDSSPDETDDSSPAPLPDPHPTEEQLEEWREHYRRTGLWLGPPQYRPTDESMRRTQDQSPIYKNFDFDRDVISVQRLAEEELFYPQKAVAKPFISGSSYAIEEVSAEDGYEQYNSPVYYLNKTNSDITYLSTMRGISASYTESSGSGMTYRYMVRLTSSNKKTGSYEINDGINNASISTELDVISVAREFYKDGIDTEFFGLAIDISGSADYTTDYDDSLDSGTDDLVGLFPYSEEFTSDIGTKYYLYRYESGEFYNKNTDTFTMPDKSSLDTDAGPLGEVYTSSGIVVLFLDKIKALYGTFDEKNHAYDYIASFGGNSEVYLNSHIYYARLENDEFNYTSNRTFYENDNPNIVKSQFRNTPRTFPTMVGFYNQKNELIAVGKISKPFEKEGTSEAIIRAEISF